MKLAKFFLRLLLQRSQLAAQALEMSSEGMRQRHPLRERLQRGKQPKRKFAQHLPLLRSHLLMAGLKLQRTNSPMSLLTQYRISQSSIPLSLLSATKIEFVVFLTNQE